MLWYQMETRLTVSNNVKRKKWPLCNVTQERIYVQKYLNPQPKVPVIQERVLSLQPNTAMKFCSSITNPPAILGPYFPTTNSQSGIPVFLVFKESARECWGKLAHLCHSVTKHSQKYGKYKAQGCCSWSYSRNLIKNRRRLSDPDGI